MDKFINLMQGQDMDPITGTFPDNCSGYLADLRKSPTFAMSLGAKELFHTNFLAYLLENQSEDKKLQCIQSKLKNLLFGHDGIGRVITWREKYSLDLVIMPAPVSRTEGVASLDVDLKGVIPFAIAVVIEAKLKSIPTQQQLDEYDLKLESGITFELNDIDQLTCNTINYKFMRLYGNDQTPGINLLSEKNNKDPVFEGNIRRILLGPTKPNVARWDYIAWQKVVDCLQIIPDECESPQSEETELLRRLICDYRKSLNNILTILCHTKLHVDEAIENKTYQGYYNAIIAKRFRDFRIHDLVGKYANFVLEKTVFNCINNRLVSFDICNKEFKLNSYTFFTNQQPGVTFEWLYENKNKKLEVSFGVTVQGNDYRHFISVDGKDESARCLVLKDLKGVLGNGTQDKNWFLHKLNDQLTLKKKNNTTLYVFTKSKFQYTKVDISTLFLKDLSEAIFSSLNSVSEMISNPLINTELCKQLNSFFGDLDHEE